MSARAAQEGEDAVAVQPEGLPSRQPDGATDTSPTQRDLPLQIPGGSELTPDESDRLRSVLGERYRIDRFVARGGMGAVFAGQHLILQTDLAIKLVHIDDQAVTASRFLREARLACSVRHPNLVQIMDCGVFAERWGYLVMEFLNGQTLASLLSTGPMDPLRVCQLGAQMARGLTAIHERGIVHCDMKPRNVLLVSQDGQPDCVKIIDFGIARSFSLSEPPPASSPVGSEPVSAALPNSKEHSVPTQSVMGTTAGTPHYMSPEQCQGSPLDGRSDMYALGCVLYEMLSGAVPFDGQTVEEIFDAHLLAPVPPLAPRSAPPPPPSLEQLILRMLAKSPAARFPSMREVEAQLRQEAELLLLQRGERVLWERDHLQWLALRDRRARRPTFGKSPLLRRMVALFLALMGIRLGRHVRPIMQPLPPLPRPPHIEGSFHPLAKERGLASPVPLSSAAQGCATGQSGLVSACSGSRRSDAAPASASPAAVSAPPPEPPER